MDYCKIRHCIQVSSHFYFVYYFRIIRKIIYDSSSDNDELFTPLKDLILSRLSEKKNCRTWISSKIVFSPTTYLMRSNPFVLEDVTSVNYPFSNS